MNRSPWFALIACCLLPLASLAAQQNSADSDPSHHHRVDRALLLLKDDDAAAPKCHIDAEERKLEAAQDELDDLHLDAASDRFLALTQSCSPGVRDGATLGFRKTHREMSTWWWQMGRHFPPFRWWHIHYPRVWYILRLLRNLIIVLILAFIVVLVLLVPVRLLLSWLNAFLGKGLAGLNTLSDQVLGLLNANRVFTRIAVMPPTPLTAGDKFTVQSNLFGSMLQNSCGEMTRRVQRSDAGLQVSAASFLSVPIDTAKGITLPTVQGIDLNLIAKILFYLVRYLGWRVESEVAFCPCPMTGGGKDTPGMSGRIVASATVRFAWMVVGGPWRVEVPADDQYDVDHAAFALAAYILGNQKPPREKDGSGFSSRKSFGSLMHGLGALLLYEQEAAKTHPRKVSLEHWMQEALAGLRECGSLATSDPLPRFCFGNALAIRNQEVYVARLKQISPACVAVGHQIGLNQLLKTYPKGSAQSGELSKWFQEETQIAAPYSRLNLAPWPFLDGSLRMFGSLLTDPPLDKVARYNHALALARRGKDDDLKKGRAELEEVLRLIRAEEEKALGSRDQARAPKKKGTHLEAPKDTDPSLAIRLQSASLRASLTVRWLKARMGSAKPWVEEMKLEEWETNVVDAKLESEIATTAAAATEGIEGISAIERTKRIRRFLAAFYTFRNLREQIIENTQANLADRADLVADHLTQEGYIYLDCTSDFTANPFLAMDLGRERLLEEAALCCIAALEIKPNWNPAQIYLALVRRIQSGLAGAYVDFLEEQVKRAEPKKDDKIEIKLEIDQAEPKPPLRSDEPKQKGGTIKHLVERAVTVFGEGIEKAIATRIENFTKQSLPEEGSSRGSTPTKSDEQKASELSSLKRQLNVRTQQKDQFSQEADNLFAALQGEPWPVTKPDTSTVKDKTDPKAKAIMVLTSQTTKGPDPTNQDS